MASTVTPIIIFSLAIFSLLLCTACYFIYHSVRKMQMKHTSTYEELVSCLYEDEDGVATAESQKQQASPAIKWVATTLAILGFLISFSLAVLITLSAVPCRQPILSTWLTFATWVCWKTPLASQLLTNHPDDPLPFGRACHVATQPLDTISIWLALRSGLFSCLHTGLFPDLRKSSRTWAYVEERRKANLGLVRFSRHRWTCHLHCLSSITSPTFGRA